MTRKNKSARESEKQALESYSLRALWQRGSNLGIMSAADSQVKPDQSSQSQPIDSVSSFNLSEVPRDRALLLSREQAFRNQQIEALKDLDRLLRLVTEQEKKYGSRLSTDSNFYRRSS